mmetsp:Transcript_1703/g.7440  ORF Transcript_1703/g.7440 Transcript_1703/m.7440 type:complete len:88 (-) Transcript_1703:2320-2583(-)
MVVDGGMHVINLEKGLISLPKADGSSSSGVSCGPIVAPTASAVAKIELDSALRHGRQFTVRGRFAAPGSMVTPRELCFVRPLRAATN